MNTTDMLWFLELSKDLHFTNAANRLYVSQQTLSNHITQLENELGTRLLFRQPSPGLTPAGELFCSFCRKFLEDQYRLQDELAIVNRQERGTIRLGASHYRLSSSFPHVISRFSRIYPHVSFNLVENASAKLEEMTSGGLLHYCIVVQAEPTPNLLAHHLMADKLYVCIPERLLQLNYSRDEISELKIRMHTGLDINDISRLPFCMLENRMGMMISDCFHQAGLQPNVFMTSTHMRITAQVCRKGLAACFITQAGLADKTMFEHGVNVVPLLHMGEPLFQNISILQMRSRELPAYALALLEMLQEYFHQLEAEDMTYICDSQDA